MIRIILNIIESAFWKIKNGGTVNPSCNCRRMSYAFMWDHSCEKHRVEAMAFLTPHVPVISQEFIVSKNMSDKIMSFHEMVKFSNRGVLPWGEDSGTKFFLPGQEEKLKKFLPSKKSMCVVCFNRECSCRF